MRSISSRSYALAVFSGVLQVLPFPIAGPVPLWRANFCWIALVPLLAALTAPDPSGKPHTLRDGFVLGYVSGITWYLGNCYWIYQTMYLYGGIAKPVSAGILLLFCLYLGLYHGLFGLLVTACHAAPLPKSLGKRAALLFAPFAWVAVEFARATVTSFPWDLLGVTQVDSPVFIRLAPVTGVYGISFVIAAVNGLWLLPISLRERRYTRAVLSLSGVAVIVLCVLFWHKLPPVREGNEATATLLQENLEVGAARTEPPMQKAEMLNLFTQLSLFPNPEASCFGIPELSQTRCRGFSAGPTNSHNPASTNLIVWPESPAPFEDADVEFRDAISRVARAAAAPVIVGNIAVEGDPTARRGYNQYNSADFFNPEGRVVARYDKMHLVPFGEYTPYKQFFFFAGSLLQDVGVFDPGRRRVVFSNQGHTYGTFICYESIFGNEVREFVKQGAEVLINISDDGWYGDTSAPWEHLNMVRMRAIENHRWVLRSTDTGVTAAIDPYGRVVQAAPRHVRTSLRVGFDYEHDLTFYSKHGDWFAWLCCVSAAGILAAGMYGRRRSAELS